MSCNCTVCTLARQSLGYSKYISKHTNPKGPTPATPKSPAAKALVVCTRCFTEIGRGKPHPCVKTQKGPNLAKIVKNTSGKSRSRVASATLKTLAEEQGVSTRGGTLQLKSGSKYLPVHLGNSRAKPKEAKFSHANLQKLQTFFHG